MRCKACEDKHGWRRGGSGERVGWNVPQSFPLLVFRCISVEVWQNWYDQQRDEPRVYRGQPDIVKLVKLSSHLSSLNSWHAKLHMRILGMGPEEILAQSRWISVPNSMLINECKSPFWVMKSPKWVEKTLREGAGNQLCSYLRMYLFTKKSPRNHWFP